MTDTTNNTAAPSALALAAALASGQATIAAADTALSYDGDYYAQGACWPDTGLIITHGDWRYSVAVWTFGSYGGASGYHGRRWTVEDADGQFSGKPSVKVVVANEDDDGNAIAWEIEIEGGANIGTSISLDAGDDRDAAARAADVIETSLLAAYAQITITEPDIDDIDVTAKPKSSEDRWVLLHRDGGPVVADIEIRRYVHPIGSDNAPVGYAVHYGYDHSLDGLIGDSEHEILEALQSRLADLERAAPGRTWLTDGGYEPTVFDGEDAADAALYAYLSGQVEPMETPDGIGIERDKEGLYLFAACGDVAAMANAHAALEAWDADDADADDIASLYRAIYGRSPGTYDAVSEIFAARSVLTAAQAQRVLKVLGRHEAEPYHLDADELRACLAARSLDPALETAAKAWGLRDVPVTRTADADAILAARDVYVSVADSIAAGNCARGTDLFRRDLIRALAPEGEIGAVSARYILSRRDDAFTRRACRQAALRIGAV